MPKSNKKKLLILGAGIYQVPLIEKAKVLGHYTIVTSIEGDYPGFKVADKKYFVDTRDKVQILDIAKSENIDGICTTGTDVAIETLGYVCDQLGLNGISQEASEKATNKIKMKTAFKKADVNSTDFRIIKSKSEAFQAFKEMNTPIMIKAVDSSGSRGISKISTIDEVPEAFHMACKVSSKKRVIAEQFIEGVEFGAQSLIRNNQLQFLLPHGDVLYTAKTNVPIGHFVPFELTDLLYQQLMEQVKKTVNALELNNCAVNFDFIINEGKVFVIEVGARAGGTCLPELVSIHYGIDYYESIICLALGEFKSQKYYPQQPCGNLIFYSKKDGIFENLTLNIKEDINIVDYKLDIEKGNMVNRFMVGPDRIGHIIINGTSQEDVRKKIISIQNSFNVNYTSN